MDVGLFGGTFDPPHVGHLVAGLDAREHLGLDRIVFLPARRSPFKPADEGTSAEDRLTMVQLAVAGDPGFGVSRVEMDREPPSYTVDTLRHLATEQPAVRWTLLVGVDQWASFARWREPQEIGRLARIGVLTREGQDPGAVDPGVDVDWVRVPVTRIDISSSALRERLRRGRSVRYLVPESVREFIESKELYAPC